MIGRQTRRTRAGDRACRATRRRRLHRARRTGARPRRPPCAPGCPAPLSPAAPGRGPRAATRSRPPPVCAQWRGRCPTWRRSPAPFRSFRSRYSLPVARRAGEVEAALPDLALAGVLAGADRDDAVIGQFPPRYLRWLGKPFMSTGAKWRKSVGSGSSGCTAPSCRRDCFRPDTHPNRSGLPEAVSGQSLSVIVYRHCFDPDRRERIVGQHERGHAQPRLRSLPGFGDRFLS